MIEEKWETIVDWPNYAVSTIGRVKRLTTKGSGIAGSVLTSFLVMGYPSVNLCHGSRRKSVRIHRLVAEAFIEKPDGCTEVNHIDATRDNNNVTNLEWVTSSENRFHAYLHGALSAKGHRNGYSKLTEDGVRLIRSGDHDKDLLASSLSVSKATVNDVLARRTWNHVT